MTFSRPDISSRALEPLVEIRWDTGGPASVAVVTVSGEIDVAAAEPLRAAAWAVVGAAPRSPERPVVMLVDLEAVTFLDMSGLDLLADFRAHGVERGWEVEVTLPAARGPRNFLRLAAGRGWLPPDFLRRGGPPLRDGVTPVCGESRQDRPPAAWTAGSASS